MKRDRFIVLPYSIHEKHLSSLMGRVVWDPLSPTERFAPENYATHGPDKICPGILEEPIAYASRADVIRNASNKELGLALTLYFKLLGQKNKTESVSINAELIHRYQMTQNELRLKKLLSDPVFASEVTELLATQDQLYFVVGFLTTKGTQWDLEKGQSRLAMARARIPAGQLAGATPDLDVEAKMILSDERSSTTSGAVEQSEIFAIAYDVITSPKSTRFWRKPAASSQGPVLAGHMRTRRDHLAMGGNDSDEEIDPADTVEGLALEIQPAAVHHLTDGVDFLPQTIDSKDQS